MADEQTNRAAFRKQEQYCITMDAPITARICAGLAESLDRETRTGARALDWPGDPTADALPLRTVGGLHALDLSGKDTELSRLFAGAVTDPAEVIHILRASFAAHDDALCPWLDGPPQTNEPGRSAGLMVGMIEIVRRFGQPIELLEIGSSAGLNLLMDRYRFDLGGTLAGPADSPVTIRPEWRGSPPPALPVGFASTRGVDVQPIDATDPAAAERLRAYVWADNPERLGRLTAGIEMQRAAPVQLEDGDAADWLDARLAEPQADGVTRVLMHSVVWQYLGAERQARITAAMEAAGAKATRARPLGWVRFEPDRGLNPRQEIWVRSWPGGGDFVKLAHSQAHGAWVEMF
ncbi:DUF2332 domain-containing protein [Sphingomonas sp. LM7]|uniref:DUF2332 domain-containing protein n=1 Tax=Sphingomonas sp. LM7 TaxID=1938607 RepID=UPI000983E241|nr:DUF2332 domain-containing protein [Sphingomonas sp. LM7]AQR75213.1 hypothetical protein BXU08_17455 [Sphingomonas sp. LM7]